MALWHWQNSSPAQFVYFVYHGKLYIDCIIIIITVPKQKIWSGLMHFTTILLHNLTPPGHSLIKGKEIHITFFTMSPLLRCLYERQVYNRAAGFEPGPLVFHPGISSISPVTCFLFSFHFFQENFFCLNSVSFSCYFKCCALG